MGSVKNTNRSKRKYGDSRKSLTASNKTRKAERSHARADRLIARTQDLIGQRVKIRTKEGPELGTVESVIPRPEGAKRSGQYLRVVTTTNRFDRARSRAKILQPSK